MNRELLDKITGGGLWSLVSEEDHYFSHDGCDYCRARTGKRLGNTVYDCEGYASLEEAQAPNHHDNLYSFRLCGECICAIANGEPWPEEMEELLNEVVNGNDEHALCRYNMTMAEHVAAREDDPIEPPGKVFANEETDDDAWRYDFRAILSAVPE